MLGQALPVLALVALTQARAIVTNHCPYNVYVWSVPQVLSGSHTDNVPLKPGGQYHEPWRHGSLINPGVAIKVSSKFNGINNFADEIDFAYVVDGNNDNYVWVDLSPVRGDAFKGNLAFHTCLGQFDSANVQTQKCAAMDDVELVLCDTSPRPAPEDDHMSLAQVKACYDYHHVSPAAQAGGLQGHVDEHTDTDSDSDSDTDCCESRESNAIKFTYTMALTAEFSGELSSEPDLENTAKSIVESIMSASADDSSNAPSTSATEIPHNAPMTSSSTSHVRLFTPPAPAPRETDCPECEKPRALSPCLARVVYPARRRVPATPRNTLDAILPPRKPNPPGPSLCDIVQRYHPGVEDCDETTLETYARDLYPKICDPMYESLLMGFPCEEVMEELKTVYPAVDTAKISRTTACECAADCDFCGHFNDTCFCAAATALPMNEGPMPLPTEITHFAVQPDNKKICLHSLCDPEIPGVDCQKAANLVGAVLLLFNERYEDWVSDSTDACQSISILPYASEESAICIADLCDLYAESCDTIETLLTSATKAMLDEDVFFIKDHATCNKLVEEQP